MHLIKRPCLIGAMAVWGTTVSLAQEQAPDIPAWLRSHIGDGEGQIARVVLQRARALYLKKVTAGVVKNPCYFAMDATRPHRGGLGKRFYTICEADRTFRAAGTGHGSGRNVKGVANFGNGKECVKNFGNALDSYLTTGGAYVTAETRTLFKGYYRASAKQEAVLVRSFVQFDGEGETANARERDIGGHAAVLLRQIRYRWMPKSPYANENGCVPVGTLEDYAGGRSNGCTSWSRPDADKIIPLLKDPTTVYIYPESKDIKAVAQAVSARRPSSSDSPYWNAVCLKQIGAPKFWSRETLGPLLARFHKEPDPAAVIRPATCKK
ncbi:hypothetical protein JQ628_29345 [Bradyrhizobium lablabi]|uniref:hypothetical protein n=1 Tax=Bradyrhizobium lablabi TaxID=722472 RepID=UPI001BAB8FA2|nr:hypothetical protein [Bradyrhizobium lablabi]